MKQYFKEHALFRLRWDVVHRTEREISEKDAPSSTSNGRRAAPGRESVGESHGEPLRNNEELQERREGVPRSPSSYYGNRGGGSNETSAVEKSSGLGMSTLEGRQTSSARVGGTSSYIGGRNESSADSVWRCGGFLVSVELETLNWIC